MALWSIYLFLRLDIHLEFIMNLSPKWPNDQLIKSANLNRKPRGSLVPSQSVEESHFLGVNQGCVSLPTLQYAHQSSHFSKARRARTSISRCLIRLGKLFVNSNFLSIHGYLHMLLNPWKQPIKLRGDKKNKSPYGHGLSCPSIILGCFCPKYTANLDFRPREISELKDA